jgi:hypothetical protein
MRPPAAGEHVTWPEAFGTRFSIIVDTEESFDWGKTLARTGHDCAAAVALPDAARRFATLGCAPAYVVTYPIVTDPRACDMLRDVIADGRSCLGTQLHGWVTPPFDEALTVANSFAGNLPRALEAAKLDALGDAFAAAFGHRPTLFRSGRYGMGPNTSGLLAERGYRVECSPRARYDYRAEGGPDFRRIGNAAFVRDGLLELPFSTVFTGAARRYGPALYESVGRLPRGRGVLARAGMLARVSLTPEAMGLHDALEAVRVALGEGERLLNLAFHSPTLVPGNTPFVRDAADLATFWRWWDGVTGLLAQRSVAYATIDEISAAACGGTSAPVSRGGAGGL